MRRAYELCYRKGPNKPWQTHSGWDFAEEIGGVDEAIARL